MGEYWGIAALLLVAAGLAAALSGLAWILGPKRPTPFKSSPYECGVAPVGDAHERFPVKFYLVAILFILFDIEVVFLWPWMTTFVRSDTPYMLFSFVEFLLYMGTWIVGYAYAMRVGAIEWDETTSLAPEKLGLDLSPIGGGADHAPERRRGELPAERSGGGAPAPLPAGRGGL